MISSGNDMPTLPRALAVAVPCVTLAGCVPYWSEPYWASSAPGARVVRSKCVGPEDVVAFELSGVAVSFHAADVESRMRPSLSLRVPTGTEVALDGTTVVASRPDGSEHALRISALRIYRARDGRDELVDVPPTERIAGATLPLPNAPSKTYHRGVHVVVDTPLDVPDAPTTGVFRIRYPRLVINGRPVDVPIISVRRARWHTAFMPLNC